MTKLRVMDLQLAANSSPRIVTPSLTSMSSSSTSSESSSTSIAETLVHAVAKAEEAKTPSNWKKDAEQWWVRNDEIDQLFLYHKQSTSDPEEKVWALFDSDGVMANLLPPTFYYYPDETEVMRISTLLVLNDFNQVTFECMICVNSMPRGFCL